MVSYIYNSAVCTWNRHNQNKAAHLRATDKNQKVELCKGQQPVWSRRLRSRENNRRNIVGLYTHHVFLCILLSIVSFRSREGMDGWCGLGSIVCSGLIGLVGRIYDTIIEWQLALLLSRMVSSSAQQIKKNTFQSTRRVENRTYS